jgi:ubiquinone/menaquinone biosynthesis C-methylase UbiE
MERQLGKTLDLPIGSMVLDAGCGFGLVADTLATESGLNVVGIDLAHNRLDKAKELVGSGVSLTEADYHHLPFPNNIFDGVFTMETLVNAKPYEKVLTEFWRVLKPGGRLVLHEYSIPPLSTVPRLVRSMAERVIERTAMHSLPRFTHGAFPDLLAEAGFVNIKVEDISKNVYPTWRYLWFDALKGNLYRVLHGSFSFPGATFIYPARHHLGYNVCAANKPA